MAGIPGARAPACVLLTLLLQLPRLHCARLDVTGPPEPILARVGEAAELPCRLPPGVSARLTELRWVRGPLSPPVLVARAGGAQDAELGPGYRGRAELLSEVPGRVALRLRGVQAADDGEYRCILRQGDSHGEARVRLQVAALGSDPHVHVDVQEDGAARLECTSAGWYPEPEVRWRTPQGRTLPATSESREPDTEGLFSVTASVVITDPSVRNVSCCVRSVLLGQEKEAEISIPAPSSPSLTPWMVAVGVIVLVLGVLTVGSIVFTWSLYKERSRQRRGEFSSTEKLLEQLKRKKATLHAVDVTLDADTAHPHLVLLEDAKSVRLDDARQKLPERPERFDSWPCVLGREAFTSGAHYWEVEVGDRADWVVGVCREDVARKGFEGLTPENGFWAVELYGNGYWALTPLRTPLALAGPPRRVGVFLDYECGDISFYDMAAGAHMYTFPRASFRGPLRPFFCLWSSGTKPLTICPAPAGLEGVTVVTEVKEPSKEIPLSPLGEDAASGDTDTLHSKLIAAQPSHGAP